MNNALGSIRSTVILALALAVPMASAVADTLDKVISSKSLRCGVQLDYPPAGFRNQQNEPEGYDVAYCKDMAKALGVEAVIVETPSSERIPALVSNRIDVLIASASISPQRAMTVNFSQPYVNYTNVVLTRKDSGVEKFADLEGRNVGGTTGTTTEQELLAVRKGWKEQGNYTGYGSEAESYLALNQGKIDGMILGNASAAALVQSGQFPNLVIKGDAPTPADLCGIAVRKGDAEMLAWVKTFVWSQVRTGRYDELYGKYFGTGKAPSLSVSGVDF
ncbi:TPA: transporter substrate-binding domain-containing protein [Pseudomonas aeruginosa]|uniref:transporter substrate-binding domain-containing protein n=1 Tax=Pseudomonas TaxID=286 RepID=UPI00093931FE|nr:MULTISPECIES: transporter substrate-binding domain-containing protein [Pseudomonas]EKX2956998.1 transporter substrate-binding domain-containing protein [Pseudomonas aeruginosa]MBG4113912.1 transporter substrate-binding domain-containing protein [Pseudomonas aeruginosa]MBI6936958.1 transporter substrate-binding domain-containing protein [Pseudomonas aeruginosa]MBI8014255.1 transporter substrate-binding domain-containing protein [Pseudomonas aeruginosa]MBV6241929.1 transporter substrate-bindi